MSIKRIAAVAAALAVSTLGVTQTAQAAPAPQEFRLVCGGETYTVVSPTEHSRAGVFSGGTQVGVLMGYPDGSADVMLSGVSPDKLTTCDGYINTGNGVFEYFGVLYLLLTPQR